MPNDKHKTNLKQRQDNKANNDDIINVKLNPNNIINKNANTNTMSSSPATENNSKSKKQQDKEAKEALMIEIEKQSLEDYTTDNITLLHGDCLERMKEIPDDSVELILCDLPYGTTKCKWDTVIDIEKLWEHYKRIIKKPTGVILLFGQQPFTSMLISSNYKWYKYHRWSKWACFFIINF